MFAELYGIEAVALRYLARDFTYVGDIVAATVAAAGAGNGVYNVGAGQPYSLLELLEILGRLTGVVPDPVDEEARAGDVTRTHADASAAAGDLGFRPSVGLEKGLEATVEWFRARLSDAPAPRVEI